MKPDQYIGTTETGDPAFDLGCFDRLHRANIIITKRLTDKLIEKLAEHRDRCILHLTCTGWGGTPVEPLVPTTSQTRRQFDKLLGAGFPVRQAVLRIDPIILTDEGMEKVADVLEAFADSGITRIRISYLDMYNHVQGRFLQAGIQPPYHQFHAPLDTRREVTEELAEAVKEMGAELEICGEPGLPSVPCVSQKDVDILGLTDTIILQGSADQRTFCHCPANKRQILTKRPGRCGNRCLYCYWKDDTGKK